MHSSARQLLSRRAPEMPVLPTANYIFKLRGFDKVEAESVSQSVEMKPRKRFLCISPLPDRRKTAYANGTRRMQTSATGDVRQASSIQNASPVPTACPSLIVHVVIHQHNDILHHGFPGCATAVAVSCRHAYCLACSARLQQLKHTGLTGHLQHAPQAAPRQP